MDVDPVLDQIKAAAGDFKQYSGVEDFTDIKSHLRNLPAVFVVPQAMSAATGNHRVGVVDQKITQRFTILVVFHKAQKGDLHNAEMAIMDAIIGWSHPDMHGGKAGTPAEFISQRTFNLNGNLASSLDFQTTYHFRK